MILCGITGGIGMGKSTFAAFLRVRGLPVIDTDVIARDLLRPGSECLSEICDQFGTDILDDDGGVNRARLGEVVFEDPSRRRILEGILHPRIRKTWLDQVARWREGERRVGFVEIPLLFETHAEGSFDRIVCVGCSRTTQMTRLRARGWSDLQSEARISAQWPFERKLDRADYLIWTDVAIGAVELQALRLIETLEGLGQPIPLHR